MLEKSWQVLINLAIPSGKCLIGNGFIFQHDNDPKHTANAVKSYLEKKEFKMCLVPRDYIDFCTVEAILFWKLFFILWNNISCIFSLYLNKETEK